jgi:hypothetical protein
MANKSDRPHLQVVGLVGVGLDGDGQTRITRNEEILLIGGSASTHEHMQEVSIRLHESLRARGKRLGNTEAGELLDLLRQATERAGR